MSETRREASDVISFPRPVVDAPPDGDAASIIAVLQDQLAEARAGNLRSVAVVTVSADGSAIGTHWSCAPGDTASLIGKLTVLTHDLMSSRR